MPDSYKFLMESFEELYPPIFFSSSLFGVMTLDKGYKCFLRSEISLSNKKLPPPPADIIGSIMMGMILYAMSSNIMNIIWQRKSSFSFVPIF